MRRTYPIKLILISFACIYATDCCAERFRIQAKSYIGLIDLTDLKQYEPGFKTCQAAMAAVIDCGTLNENPRDGSKASGGFRLRSELDGAAICEGSSIANWSFQPVDKDFGTEFVIFSTSGGIAKALSAIPALSGSTPTKKVTFTFRLRGQPNPAGNLAMSAVKPRTCTYIWHEVRGSLTCVAGKLSITAQLAGSRFPSHKLWIDGREVEAIPQGPFSSLWHCDEADSSLVK